MQPFKNTMFKAKTYVMLYVTKLKKIIFVLVDHPYPFYYNQKGMDWSKVKTTKPEILSAIKARVKFFYT